MILESIQHQHNSYLTLTYSDENLPRLTNGTSTLDPADARNWLKRIRKELAPAKLRYFLVGEYGDESFRPHYHAAAFGLERCARGQTLRFRGRPVASRCCDHCRLVQRTWDLGDVDCGGLEEGSIQYVAGYVTKKMTHRDDARLDGRYPEFARMSLKPGIGYSALWEIASVMLTLGLDESEVDVPSTLRHGSRIWPLGRYLQQNLRKMVGKETNVPEEILEQIAEKMLPLRLAARSSQDLPSFKKTVLDHFAQDVLNFETRNRIFGKKRGSL